MAEKIVYLLDSFDGPYGGTETQLWHILKKMDKSQFVPELVLLRHSDFSLANDTWPCSVRVLDIEKLFSPDGIGKVLGLVRYLRQSDAKLLQAFFSESSLLGPLLARLSGMKYIASRRDMGIWYRPLLLFYLRAVRNLVDCVIVNSRAVRDLVSERERIPENRIHVVINGLEPLPAGAVARFDPWPGAGAAAQSRDLVIGIVANLKKVKRIDVLLRAFETVQATIPASRLIIVGEGSLEGELRQLAGSLGILGKVEFTGRLEEPAQTIGSFDIAVLCSESEGMSNALMEYLRAGKPVVCTNVGGNPELVAHGRNGYLVAVGEHAALAQSILDIATNRELYRAMAQSAVQSVQQYTLEAMVQRHMDIYLAVVRGIKHDELSYKTT